MSWNQERANQMMLEEILKLEGPEKLKALQDYQRTLDRQERMKLENKRLRRAISKDKQPADWNKTRKIQVPSEPAKPIGQVAKEYIERTTKKENENGSGE